MEGLLYLHVVGLGAVLVSDAVNEPGGVIGEHIAQTDCHVPSRYH